MAKKQAVQAPKDVPLFADQPIRIGYDETRRFLWGDEQSGEVNDIIYGRGQSISCLIFTLAPGRNFCSSERWKALFDQDRFYYVLAGELTIQDPDTGDVAVARPGEAIFWRGAKWHFGFNFGTVETVVLDWYAPQERRPDVPEVVFGETKPDLGEIANARRDLLGAWPAALPDERDRRLRDGAVVTLTENDALHVLQGEISQARESLFVSTDQLTAGSLTLPASFRGDVVAHEGGDKVIFCEKGRVNVHLPESFDWYELGEKDCLYLPRGTPHQFWNYTGEAARAMFYVVPDYA